MKTETENTTASSVCICTTEDFVNPGKIIVTSPFKSSSAAYTAVALKHVALKWWWVIVLPVVVFCILALTLDLKWLLVALIFLFLITPFLVAHVYFSRLLTHEARLAVLTKEMQIIPEDKITVTYMNDEGEQISSEIIPWKQVCGVTPHGNGWMIELKASPIVGIIIPRSAITGIYEKQK